MIDRLELKPGDVIVLSCDHYISHQTAEAMRDAMEEKFPGHRVLVLGDGFRISLLTHAG